MSENVICRKTQDDLIEKLHSQPLFSVVIPTLNEAENIIKLIKEIKTGTRENEPYEIVIVDDNSPDDTVGTLLNDFTDDDGFKVYKIRQNIGLQSHQFNLSPKGESLLYQSNKEK